MLSKNTTRGARGQPELNAARLRNAQQVGHKLVVRGGVEAGVSGKEEWQTDRLKQQASPTSAFFPESSTTTDDI